MRLLLRCDGGPGIGVGHVVRSLALAEEALRAGHEVSLLGEVAGDFLDGLAATLGPRLVRLGPARSDQDLVDAALDHDVVHLDHYGLPQGVAADIAAAADAAGRPRPLVASVADGDYGVQVADVVVDPTVGAERRPTTARARWLLRGGRFVALRGSVTRAAAAPRPSERLTVLVVMGGTDAGGCAPAVLEALAATGVALDVTVVATPETRERLDALAAGWTDGSVRVTGPVPDLPAVMAASDVVVSAAGTTTWELCALGRPMAVLAVVDNQRPGHDVLVAAGAAVGLGGADALAHPAAVAERLRPLLTDAALRADLAARAHALVDGRGAWRVVRMLEEARTAGPAPEPAGPAVEVRPATADDADLLLAWRNDPTTRAVSRTTEEVARPDHVAWLAGSIERPDRHLLVGSVGDEPVGTVRWDDEGAGEWEVSITVAPAARGRRLAVPMLLAAQDWLAGHLPEPPSATLAVVRADNIPSRRLFLAAGYAPDLPPDDAGFERWVRTLR